MYRTEIARSNFFPSTKNFKVERPTFLVDIEKYFGSDFYSLCDYARPDRDVQGIDLFVVSNFHSSKYITKVFSLPNER